MIGGDLKKKKYNKKKKEQNVRAEINGTSAMVESV